MTFWEDYDELSDKEKIGALRSLVEDLQKTNQNLLQTLEQPVTWQPIATAQKLPRKNILTWGYTPAVYGYSEREYKFSISSWGNEDWNSQATPSFGPRFVPTHWMPLPEPPEKKS